METATPNTAKPKARRRWLPFSLRTLLIFVTLAGFGFGWLGFKIRAAQRQQAAVAAIEKSGCDVGYDYQFNSQGDYEPNATPPGPAWLHLLVGDDFFRNVYSVGLGGFLVSGRQRPFRDADLEFVKGLKTLKVLQLSDTQVSDAGLQHLRGLTTLKSLNLYNLQVTDAGLANLMVLTRLEELDLGNTHVTDAGLDYLKRLAQLRDLNLHGTQVADAGLAKLQGLTSLEHLDLRDTRVSDAGLDYLKGLTHLKLLSLNKTQVSDSGVAKLRQALPNCQIVH